MTDDTESTALLAEFQDKAEALGVVVVRVASPADAAARIAEWANLLESAEILAANSLANGAPRITDELRQTGIRVTPPESPDAVRDAPLGATMARLAVAETGSVLLAERETPERSVSMLTLSLAVVCPTRRLVPSLDEAMRELRELALSPGGAFATLLTGPSRTADIERVLTVGVQGPGKVMVVFVDEV